MKSKSDLLVEQLMACIPGTSPIPLFAHDPNTPRIVQVTNIDQLPEEPEGFIFNNIILKFDFRLTDSFYGGGFGIKELKVAKDWCAWKLNNNAIYILLQFGQDEWVLEKACRGPIETFEKFIHVMKRCFIKTLVDPDRARILKNLWYARDSDPLIIEVKTENSPWREFIRVQ